MFRVPSRLAPNSCLIICINEVGLFIGVMAPVTSICSCSCLSIPSTGHKQGLLIRTKTKASSLPKSNQTSNP